MAVTNRRPGRLYVEGEAAEQLAKVDSLLTLHDLMSVYYLGITGTQKLCAIAVIALAQLL